MTLKKISRRLKDRLLLDDMTVEDSKVIRDTLEGYELKIEDITIVKKGRVQFTFNIANRLYWTISNKHCSVLEEEEGDGFYLRLQDTLRNI